MLVGAEIWGSTVTLVLLHSGASLAKGSCSKTQLLSVSSIGQRNAILSESGDFQNVNKGGFEYKPDVSKF